MLVVFRKCHIKVQISANISENSRPLWLSVYTMTIPISKPINYVERLTISQLK